MKIKISKSQWEKMGRTAGWMKQAMPVEYDPKEMEQAVASYDPQVIKKAVANAIAVTTALNKLCRQVYSAITTYGEGAASKTTESFKSIAKYTTTLLGIQAEADILAKHDASLAKELLDVISKAKQIIALCNKEMGPEPKVSTIFAYLSDIGESLKRIQINLPKEHGEQTPDQFV
jgi:hypothetical protein